MVQRTEQTILQRKPEYIEKLEQGIFDALFFTRDDRKFITDADGKPIPNPNFGKPITTEVDGEQVPMFGGLLGGFLPREGLTQEDLFRLPDFQVAPLDPLQQSVLTELASDEFKERAEPFFQFAEGTAIPRALSILDAAPIQIQQGIGAFDPEKQTMDFFNPFRRAVIDESIKEIDRQAALARIVDDAKAVRSGAFGGSRSGVQRAETAKRVQEAKNKTISDLLSKGFDTAQQAALKADELAKQRALNAARLASGVGAAVGQLGATAADIGRVYSTLTGQDLATKSAAGAQRQALDQTILDAQRASAALPLQEVLAPLGIGQKFLAGSPSAASVDQFKQSFEPSPNPFLSGIGAATALQGLYK